MHRYESFEHGHGPMGLGRRCAMVGARMAPLLGMMALATAVARVTSRAEAHAHRHCCGHDHHGWDDHEDERERPRRGRGDEGRRFRTGECERCGHHRHWD